MEKNIFSLIKELVKTNGIWITFWFVFLLFVIVFLFLLGWKLIPHIVKKVSKKDNLENENINKSLSTIKDCVNSLIYKINSSIDVNNYLKLVKILLGTNNNFISVLKQSIYDYIEKGLPYKQFYLIENLIKDFLDSFIINTIKDFIFNDVLFDGWVKKEIHPIRQEFIENLKSILQVSKKGNNEDMKAEIDILINSFLKELEENFVSIYKSIIMLDNDIIFIKKN